MKEIMHVVLRSNIISDYLRGLKRAEIVRKYNCSSKTVSRWIAYYKKKKAEMNESGRLLRVRQERIERAERSLRGERGKRPELTEEDKHKNLEKQILADLNAIDLSKKKRDRKRFTYIPFKIQQYLYKQFADKRTGGKEGRSIRKVIARANKKFKLKDPKKLGDPNIPKEERKLSYGSVQRFLVSKFGHARKLIKKPLLKPSHISQRKVFAEYIVKNEIDYKKIFFTDEKRFIMNFVPNKQTNQIRLSKKTQHLLKQNNQEVEKLLTIPVEKNPKGVMVAGGVSYYGVGKLNFIVGPMDSCAYEQTLHYYQEDIEYYKTLGVDLIFQQDNCPSHVSAEIKKTLSTMYKLDFWPPNSPDLSPIECVWAEVQAKLEGYTFKSMDDFKKKIVYEWNRVPEDYCHRIFDKFIEDIRQIYKFGRVKEKNHVSKGLVFKKKGLYKDEIENIVYNKYSLKNVIKYNIKELKKNNQKLKSIIYKIKSNKFKNRVKDEVNNEQFDQAYNEVVNENEELYIKNKKEIKKLKRIPLKEYFETLTYQQKVKLCNLSARYNEEFKQGGIISNELNDIKNPEENIENNKNDIDNNEKNDNSEDNSSDDSDDNDDTSSISDSDSSDDIKIVKEEIKESDEINLNSNNLNEDKVINLENNEKGLDEKIEEENNIINEKKDEIIDISTANDITNNKDNLNEKIDTNNIIDEKKEENKENTNKDNISKEEGRKRRGRKKKNENNEDKSVTKTNKRILTRNQKKADINELKINDSENKNKTDDEVIEIID